MPFWKTTKRNPVIVTTKLLRLLRVSFCKGSLKTALEAHPDYPSLSALSDCLNEWRVATIARRIAREDYSPAALTFPFIAHLTTDGGRFVLIHSITARQRVVYSDEKSDRAVMSEADFLNTWRGVVLHAATSAESGQPGYRSAGITHLLHKIRVPFLLLTLLAALLLGTHVQAITAGYAGLLFLKLGGATVSILLLIQSVDAGNPLIQNLCGTGKRNNCNAILGLMPPM